MINEKYWDHDTYTLGPLGENEIVFTSEYWVMTKRLDQPIDYTYSLMAIRKMMDFDRKGFSSRVMGEPWSHDNQTALVCLSKLCNFDFHHKVFWKDWQWRMHPRDFIFYVWASGGFWGTLFTLILPIALTLAALEVFLRQYKDIDGDKVLMTDGKLLTWLKINSFSLPLTKKVCDFWIDKYYGGWQNIFKVYFKDENHPLNVMIQQLEKK